MAEHAWVIAVAVGLTAEDMESVREARIPDMDKLVNRRVFAPPQIGCWTCEQPFSVELLDSSCPGDPVDYEARPDGTVMAVYADGSQGDPHRPR
jgi:hypothetical protein